MMTHKIYGGEKLVISKSNTENKTHFTTFPYLTVAVIFYIRFEMNREKKSEHFPSMVPTSPIQYYTCSISQQDVGGEMACTTICAFMAWVVLTSKRLHKADMIDILEENIRLGSSHWKCSRKGQMSQAFETLQEHPMISKDVHVSKEVQGLVTGKLVSSAVNVACKKGNGTVTIKQEPGENSTDGDPMGDLLDMVPVGTEPDHDAHKAVQEASEVFPGVLEALQEWKDSLHTETSVLLITRRERTFAVASIESVYYLFDPHGRNPAGRELPPGQKGKAVCITFILLSDLSDYIIRYVEKVDTPNVIELNVNPNEFYLSYITKGQSTAPKGMKAHCQMCNDAVDTAINGTMPPDRPLFTAESSVVEKMDSTRRSNYPRPPMLSPPLKKAAVSGAFDNVKPFSFQPGFLKFNKFPEKSGSQQQIPPSTATSAPHQENSTQAAAQSSSVTASLETNTTESQPLSTSVVENAAPKPQRLTVPSKGIYTTTENQSLAADSVVVQAINDTETPKTSNAQRTKKTANHDQQSVMIDDDFVMVEPTPNRTIGKVAATVEEDIQQETRTMDTQKKKRGRSLVK